jgi:small conductance mechanosensitive channel
MGLLAREYLMSITLGQTVNTEIDQLIDVSAVTPWDFLWATLVIVTGIVLAGLLRRGIRSRFSQSNLDEGLLSLLSKVAGWVTIALAVVFALPLLGVDFTPVYLLILLAAAVAVVSGRTLIENYGAGLVLQAEATFGPGDQVLTEGHQGRVVEVSSRIVELETLDGRKLVLPNVSVMANPVEVLTSRPERRSELVVGLEYGTDLETARGVLRGAAQGAAGVLDEPPVEVHAAVFGESSIDFLVWYWHGSDVRSAYEATDEVVRSINRACNESGLKIAFPQRTLWWGELSERNAS